MPYNPQTENQIPQILMQVGQQFGRDMGSGIQQFMEQRKKRAEQVKMDRQILKVMAKDPNNGLDADEVETLGADDLRAQRAALEFKNNEYSNRLLNEQRQANIALAQAQQENEFLKTAIGQRRQEQWPAMSQRVQELQTGVPPAPADMRRFYEADANEMPEAMRPQGTPGLVPEQAFMQASGEFPAFAPQDAREIQAFMEMGGRGGREQFAFDPNKHVVPIERMPGFNYVQTSKGGGQLAEGADSKAAAAAAAEQARQAREEELIRLRQDVKPKVTAVYDPVNGLRYEGEPEAVEKFVQEMMAKSKGAGGAKGSNAAPANAPAPTKPAKEIVRETNDGKKAVFDAETKEFLRYAD